MKKRKKSIVRDEAAPKPPLSGWVRFMNERREYLRAENPNVPLPELTKLIAHEWSQLELQQKQQYLDAAEQDRERYTQEMAAYKQTESYRQFNESKMKKKMKTTIAANEEIACEKESEISAFDIPIFTEEFLEFNKIRETELRQLRKASTDLEQQNSILDKHLDNLKQAIDKLQAESVERSKSNTLLQQHLQKMRASFVEKFANIALPGTNETPSLQNVDQYISKLHTLLQDSSNTSLLNTVKTAVADIDLAF